VARNYELVSADAHLETRPDWVERLPEDLKPLAPRIVEVENGGQGWAMGDDEPIPLGLAATGGQKYTEFVPRGRRFDEGIPGTGGPEQRISEQDKDGVDGEVLFSSVATTALRKSADNTRAVVEFAKAYNNWVSDYCSHAPDRLFGIALMPMSSTDDAVAELRRVRELPGIRGTQLLQFPSGEKWLTPHDEPFWATAEELGMTVVAHHNFGGVGQSHALAGLQKTKSIDVEGSADFSQFVWLLTTDLQIPTLPIVTLLQLMVGGVLDRYPGLKLHFAETGIGWLPYWLEQMEDRYDRHRFWSGVQLERRPADYVRSHFTFSFQEDRTGVKARDDIGVGSICWASDFPHSVSDWPWSRENVARQMAGVPDVDRRRIQGLNILVQLGVLSSAEADELATKPLERADPDIVPARGERRVA